MGPLVVWVQRFRLDDSAGAESAESSFLLTVLQSSVLWRLWPKRRWRAPRTARKAYVPLRRGLRKATRVLRPRRLVHLLSSLLGPLAILLLIGLSLAALLGLYRVGRLLIALPGSDWARSLAPWAPDRKRRNGACLCGRSARPAAGRPRR